MKRLYYIVEEIEDAEHISIELAQNGINSHHIHVLSKNESGVVTHHLHGPNIFERLDIFRGAINGFLTGLIVSIVLLVVAQLFLGLVMSFTFQLAIVAFFLLFGSWVGGMVGFAHENVHLQKFHQQIEKGRHLMMIDVAKPEERLVRRVIEHLNEAQFGGEDEHIYI